MAELDNLPLIGRTNDVKNTDSLEYWRCIFSGIWGPVELTEIGGGRISGTLRSRTVAEMNFNQITFGNQLFECVHGHLSKREEPFYSLTFPQSGKAECFVGSSHMRLVPGHAYLVNVGRSARLSVDNHYSTFNIQIPISKLEHRLGRTVEIRPRSIIKSDAIYHIMRNLIRELNCTSTILDDATRRFISNQLLDTVAFFLFAGNSVSEDSLAIQSIRARALAYMTSNFRNECLSPIAIAQACGVSRSYIYKVFSDGPSIMEHIRRRRLDAAREMLENRSEKLTMTQVAMACGFSSSSEFSRLYKKEFGIRPSEQ